VFGPQTGPTDSCLSPIYRGQAEPGRAVFMRTCVSPGGKSRLPHGPDEKGGLPGRCPPM
jgi:hypothetical protein